MTTSPRMMTKAARWDGNLDQKVFLSLCKLSVFTHSLVRGGGVIYLFTALLQASDTQLCAQSEIWHCHKRVQLDIDGRRCKRPPLVSAL